MRWFKHLTNAHNDEAISELVDEFGLEGYGAWWIILEIIAHQMDKTDRCSVRYSVRKWAKSCQISVKKFQKIVSFLSKIEKLSLKKCEKNSNFLIIECRNLLKYRDEYSKKSGQNQEGHRIKSLRTPDQETETETETDINKGQSTNQSKNITDSSQDKQIRQTLIKKLYDIKDRLGFTKACVENIGFNTPVNTLKRAIEITEKKQADLFKEGKTLEFADNFIKAVIENTGDDTILSSEDRLELEKSFQKEEHLRKKHLEKEKEKLTLKYYEFPIHKDEDFKRLPVLSQYELILQDENIYADLSIRKLLNPSEMEGYKQGIINLIKSKKFTEKSNRYITDLKYQSYEILKKIIKGKNEKVRKSNIR